MLERHGLQARIKLFTLCHETRKLAEARLIYAPISLGMEQEFISGSMTLCEEFTVRVNVITALLDYKYISRVVPSSE